MKYISEEIKPDLIIWTGDSQNHDVWSQNEMNQTYPQQLITSLIKEYLPETQMYPIFGNHECFPADVFSFNNNYSLILKNQSMSMWMDYLTPESRNQLLHQGFYAQINTRYNLKFIALNTQACDVLNFWLLSNVTDPGDQLQWLEDQLKHSETNQIDNIIFGHIPPGDSTCNSNWAKRYNILVERFANIITA